MNERPTLCSFEHYDLNIAVLPEVKVQSLYLTLSVKIAVRADHRSHRDFEVLITVTDILSVKL